MVGGKGLRMSHDGIDGGAKAPIASKVEAPRAPTTNALREILVLFVIDICFAGCGGTVGAFAEGEGAVLGWGVGFFSSSDMSSVALKQYFSSSRPNRIKDLSIRYGLFSRLVISETI